jgi:hypothetical protein
LRKDRGKCFEGFLQKLVKNQQSIHLIRGWRLGNSRIRIMNFSEIILSQSQLTKFSTKFVEEER